MKHRIAEMADKQFARHTITDAPSKSWRCAAPDTWAFGYYVTWSPGSLALSGDLGELTLTHYHAMPTWTAAAGWLRGAAYDYCMEKSSTSKVFDPEATLASLIHLADGEQQWDPDAPLWRRLFDDLPGPALLQDKNYRNKAHQAEFISAIRKWPAAELFTPESVHEFGIDDFYGSYSWPEHTRWQYAAFQLWAEMVAADEMEAA